MSRTVNKELLNKWIEENGPYGHEKLSVEAEVSYPTIGAIRRGHVPTEHVQRRIIKVTGLLGDDLFPSAVGKVAAS